MVGRLPDTRRAGRLGFAREGDAIALAGWDASPSLAGGELAKLWGDPLPDDLPAVDLAHARVVLEAVRDAVRGGTLSSCHDIAEGGLLVALAECCLSGGLGAALDLGPSDEPWCHLFGELPVGFVLSGPRDALDALARTLPLDVFGTVGGDALELTIAGEPSRWALAELREAHGALGRFFP
jgi:phosphoribosylformylglycinamidine synthase